MIPDNITLQYSRQRGTSNEWKVSEVMEFLQKEILSRERTMQLIKSAPVTAKHNTVKNVWQKGQKIEIEALETPQVCTAVMKIPDYYWCIVSGQVERITDALVAVESIFGWSVQGPVKMPIVADAACMQVQVSEDALVLQHLKAFWEIESLGITMKQTENPEEEEALLQFEKTTQYKDGRYKVELPWRPDKPGLQDDYRTAKKRFEGLKRKLQSDLVLCHNIKESELCWKGPPFLKTPNLTEESDGDQRDEDVSNELKQVKQISVQLNSSSDQSETEPVLDLLKYSKLKKVSGSLLGLRDNAKTFKRANQDLSKLWQAVKDPQLLEYFSGKNIVWRFIVERAAWWGGFWERLVREVEATLNSRPLTFVHNKVDEPAHFLVGEQLTALPPKPFPADHDHLTVSKEEMTRRWRYRNRLMTNL
ncbi:pao retrotransposon peptidase family [Labeo rohita]|uniref:Pao retrotransposon peptidase family n=1 Tax=Labeo rohita TaxID=84645 RepID=A0A498LE87_LABRO|nr:pao retrotransposon peptidase family [Labeo rohita]RXN13754.1 pao retrotransposon peptidase family [Labeo rohita]